MDDFNETTRDSATRGGGPPIDLDIWLQEYLHLGRSLAAGRISQEAWREGMDGHFHRLDLGALRARLDLDQRRAALDAAGYKGRGEFFDKLAVDGARPVPGPEPARVVITKVAWIQKGFCVPPHAHLNMVSTFLVLAGSFRVRHYEKVGAMPGELLIRPSFNAVQGPGAWSTITDAVQNVHWLSALEEGSCLFTTKLIHLREGELYKGRIHLDMHAARPASDGLLRVPIINAQKSKAIYGP